MRKLMKFLSGLLLSVAIAVASTYNRDALSAFRAKVKGWWEVVCYAVDGSVRWVEAYPNIVVNVALNDILSAYLDGGTQTTAWYVGLKGTGTPVAGDTMGSHGSWSEDTTYSNGTRPQWNGGTASGGSIDNSASKASFSINGTSTIYGAFLSSNSTKGGTTGTLYAAGDFASSKSVTSGDTLDVTATFTMADDGV